MSNTHCKPSGAYLRCRACGTIWKGEDVFQDPMSTALKWTCGDLECGGTCDFLSPEYIVKALNTRVRRTAEKLSEDVYKDVLAGDNAARLELELEEG